MASSVAGGDLGTRGFLDREPDPLRYSAATRQPNEATGMLCDRIPLGARVLDVGCGTGSISALLASECHATLVGIEPNPERADACRTRGLNVENGYYDEETATRLGAFDVIVFADVLEHVSDPASLLELASRHLTPNGIVLVSTPNVAHWTVRTALLRGHFDYQPMGIMDATHLRWFTSRTIRRVFESVGLDVVDHDWTSGSWMQSYRHVPRSLRRNGVRALVRTLPDLFGCQHIVTGAPRNSAARTAFQKSA